MVKHPVISSPDTENIKRNLSFFGARLGCSSEQALGLLLSQTSLLTYDVDRNLRPTMCFFKSLLGREQGLSLIKDHPGCLKYSLIKRLIPRRHRMIMAGTNNTNSHFHHFRFLPSVTRFIPSNPPNRINQSPLHPKPQIRKCFPPE